MGDKGLIHQRELLGTYQKRIFEINNFWRQVIRFMDYHGSEQSCFFFVFNSYSTETVEFNLECMDYLGNSRTLVFYPHHTEIRPYLNVDFLSFIYPQLNFFPIMNQLNFEKFIMSLNKKELYETLLEMKNQGVEDLIVKY
jgi:hypothetical protein